MKMMKHALICLLAAVMVLSLAACGQQSQSTPAAPSSQASSGTPAPAPAPALDYPKQDINLIIPYAAGGEGDNNFRCIEKKLSEVLDVNVVVEYLSGGNAIPGSQSVLDAKPDGYTIGLLAAGAVAIQPWMGTASYTLDDFQGIACLTASPILFAINEKQPYDDFASWLEYAKANPGACTISIGSLGGTPHLAIAKVLSALGVEVTYVPYKGNAEAYAACLSGEVQGYVAVASGVVGKEGLKTLANFGSNAGPGYEEVPNLADLGLDPALATDAFFGLLCSAKVDGEVVGYLSDLVGEIMADPAVQANFDNLNLTRNYLPADEFNTYMQEQYVGYQKVIDELGLAKPKA